MRKRFGATVALDGLDLGVKRGELLAVLGPNGSGKTTAISLMLGLLSPDEGTARLFGRPPRSVEARRHVGVMLQDGALTPELEVRELVDLATSYYPSPLSADEALEVTNTTALARRPYGKLSGGQKRQAQFAVAVCGRPSLIFLDEPTVGMDLAAREGVWRTIRRLVDDGVSVVLTTHHLEEAEALADRVAVLVKGRVVASGTVSEIKAHVVRRRIWCSTRLATLDVALWPGVESVSTDRGLLTITASNAESVVRRLLAADPDLGELEVRRAGLHEAFSEITQEVR